MRKSILLIILLFMGNLNATTYYVDSDGGHDDSLGTSPSTAWKTINWVNGYKHFDGGDIVSFKCGTRIYGQTLIPPIDNLTFNSYDFGEKPVIDRDSSVTINISTNYCVDMGDDHQRNYITFNGIKFVHGNWSNILMYNNTHITIESCNIDSAYTSQGHNNMNIYSGGDESGKNSYLTVRNSTMNWAGGSHGIYLDGTDNVLMEYDTLFNNFHDGIRIAGGDDKLGSNNLIARYCVIRYNHYSQIENSGATNSNFYYNWIETDPQNTPDHQGTAGIYLHEQTDDKGESLGFRPVNDNYYNNTVIMHNIYSWDSPVVWIQPDSNITGQVFKNNIFYCAEENSNPDKKPIMEWWEHLALDGKISSYTFTNNCWYLPGNTSNMFYLFDSNHVYSNLNTWQSVSGYETNSIQANPNFINISSGNYLLQNNSPASLAGVWLGLPAQDIAGNHIDNPPDIGAYQNSTYLSGTLSSNTTLSGNVALIGNLTVPSDKVLTISSGTHIKVTNGTTLYIYGTFLAQGTSQNPITINYEYYDPQSEYDYNLITFYGTNTSNSIIDHTNIYTGNGIECFNGADVTIQNCSLYPTWFGIYIYSSQPQIINNLIFDPYIAGIIGSTYYSSPLIQGNAIQKVTNRFLGFTACIEFLNSASLRIVNNNCGDGFNYGIYMSESQATFGNGLPGLIPNNNISGCHFGIYATSGSYLDGAEEGNGYNGYNDIMQNDTDICVYGSSAVHAWYDYFGNTAPTFDYDTTSFVDIDNILPLDPWGRWYNSNQKNHMAPLTSNKNLTKSLGFSNGINDSISVAILLENNGNINDAISLYKNFISEDHYVRIALSQLARIKFKYTRDDLSNYFVGLLTSNQKHYTKVKKILGDIYLQNNQFDNAILAYNDVILNDSIGFDGVSARFEKLFAYQCIKKNKQVALSILSEIKSLNLTDNNTQMRINMAETLLGISNNRTQKNKDNLIGNNLIPTKYELYQNYPNPFNPSTTIRYQILKPGVVTLKVYDILGREVSTLVNEYKIEGSYEFTFNASRFSSGVYIYQLRAGNFVSSKKMLLVK